MHPTLVRDSATQLDPHARGSVVVCGSHGGLYPAWLAARAGVRAAIFNDAGIGRSAAGVGGVYWLGGLGIAACAVDCQSARIADGADMLANGIVSTANDAAAALGCRPGQPVREAVAHLAHAHAPQGHAIPDIGETRAPIANAGHRPAWALDSVALVEPRDARAIVVTRLARGARWAASPTRPRDGRVRRLLQRRRRGQGRRRLRAPRGAGRTRHRGGDGVERQRPHRRRALHLRGRRRFRA